MAVSDAYVFPDYLTPVLTQNSFKSHRVFFSNASVENTPEKKFRLNRVSNSQPPGHESDTLTTEPPELWVKLRRNTNEYPFTLI